MPRNASLFVTDAESVRLVTDETDTGLIELGVYGPNEQREVYIFNAPDVCEHFEAEMIARLLRAGFTRAPISERRSAERR